MAAHGLAVLPRRRLAYAVPDERNQQGRRPADHEHPSPAVARPDHVVGDCCEEEAEVIAGVHVAAAGLAAILGPFFGDEGAAHRPFAADADSGQKAQRGELPDAGHDTAQEREQRVTEDGERQRAHPSEAVRDRPPDHRDTPADQKQREQHAPVEADVAGRCRDA